MEPSSSGLEVELRALVETPSLSSVDEAKHRESPGYSNYVLAALFVVYIFNFVDRQILAILIQPIKEDLGVSDTMMGLLTGPVFVISYTLAGLPLARWADRHSRVWLITSGMVLWSAMTVASGFARSFVQLAVARLGVGLGEATFTPSAHSLIADYFSPASTRDGARDLRRGRQRGHDRGLSRRGLYRAIRRLARGLPLRRRPRSPRGPDLPVDRTGSRARRLRRASFGGIRRAGASRSSKCSVISWGDGPTSSSSSPRCSTDFRASDRATGYRPS